MLWEAAERDWTSAGVLSLAVVPKRRETRAQGCQFSGFFARSNGF